MQITIRDGAELPDWTFDWTDSDGATIDFSAGWAFELTIGPTADGAALVTKSSGISGAATLPNVTLSFAAGELDPLDAETPYVCQLTGTSGGRQRDFPDFTLWLTPRQT